MVCRATVARPAQQGDVVVARHRGAAAGAVLLSLLFHGIVLKWSPVFPMGEVRFDEAPGRYKSVRLEKVWTKPERLMAAERRSPRPPVIESKSLPNLLQDIGVPVPDKPLMPLRRESETPTLDLAHLARSAAVPYEEVLQVEQALYEDRVSSLPRRYEEPIERRPATSDFKPPTEWLTREKMVSSVPPSALAQAMREEGKSSEQAALDFLVNQLAALSDSPIGDNIGPVIPADEIGEATRPIEEYLTLAIRVFRPQDEDAVYFEMAIRPARHDALRVLPRDVLFIQDVSESMTQAKVNACRMGLLRWLNTLNAGDRFDVVEFRENVRACFGIWSDVHPLALAKARTFMGEMQSRGNTDILRLLEAILQWPQEERRVVIAILCSDGRPTAGVVDSCTIISRFSAQNAGTRSVFAVSGGRRVNRFLIDLLTFDNRGDHWMVDEPEDIPLAMSRAAGELQRPVLAGLRFRATGTVSTNLYPAQPTHLYLDRPLVLYGKTSANASTFAVQIVGQSADALCDIVFPIRLAQAAEGAASIREGWARQRVYALLRNYLQSRSAAVLMHLRDVAQRYGVALPYNLEAP